MAAGRQRAAKAAGLKLGTRRAFLTGLEALGHLGALSRTLVARGRVSADCWLAWAGRLADRQFFINFWAPLTGAIHGARECFLACCWWFGRGLFAWRLLGSMYVA